MKSWDMFNWLKLFRLTNGSGVKTRFVAAAAHRDWLLRRIAGAERVSPRASRVQPLKVGGHNNFPTTQLLLSRRSNKPTDGSSPWLPSCVGVSANAPRGCHMYGVLDTLLESLRPATGARLSCIKWLEQRALAIEASLGTHPRGKW